MTASTFAVSCPPPSHISVTGARLSIYVQIYISVYDSSLGRVSIEENLWRRLNVAFIRFLLIVKNVFSPPKYG